MDGKLIKQPVAIGTFTNKTFNKSVRRREARSLALNADDKEIGERRLNFSLNVRRKEGKPDTKGAIGTESVQRRNKPTIVLGMLHNPVPPVREVGNGRGIKDRKLKLEVFLVLSIETAIGKVSEKEFPIHVNSRSTERKMNKNTMIGARSRPRKNRAGGGINNHVSNIIDITLIVLPSSALTKRRKGGPMGKEWRKTHRIGKTSTLSRVPGRILGRSRSGSRRRSRRRDDRSSRRWITGRERKGRKGARRRRDNMGLTTKLTKGGKRIMRLVREQGDTGSAGRGMVENSRRSKRGHTHIATEGRRDGRGRSETSGGWQQTISGRRRHRDSGAKQSGESSNGAGKSRSIRWTGERMGILRNGSERRRDCMGAKSSAKKATSLAREDDENREGRLRVRGTKHFLNASLKERWGKRMIRAVPGSQGDIVADIGGCIRRSEKKIGEGLTSGVIRVQRILIQIVLKRTESDLQDDLLVVGSKLSGRILLAQPRDREETTVKSNGRREERFDVENRGGGQRGRRRRVRWIRRHQRRQRKREKGRNNLLLTSIRVRDET
jgi:hypothetical protein